MRNELLDRAAYQPVYNSTTESYDVESEDGIVMDGIPTWEAATHLAALFCLGHLMVDNSGCWAITLEAWPDQVHDVIADEEEDDEEYTDPAEDDGPTYEQEEEYAVECMPADETKAS